MISLVTSIDSILNISLISCTVYIHAYMHAIYQLTLKKDMACSISLIVWTILVVVRQSVQTKLKHCSFLIQHSEGCTYVAVWTNCITSDQNQLCSEHFSIAKSSTTLCHCWQSLLQDNIAMHYQDTGFLIIAQP